jgi:threonine synthase
LQLSRDLTFAKMVGKTPCRELAEVSALCGYRVFGKLETYNPTGSHKDRESLEVIKDAIAQGFNGVGCASTGNAAISLAALSRMANLTCHIYISTRIAPDKLSLIRAFHPMLHMVKGDYDAAVEKSREEMHAEGVYSANPGESLAKIEGDRNIGREISGSINPDVLVCPTNNGTHFIGVMQGLAENDLKPIAIAATARNTKIADSIRGFHKYEGVRWEDTAKLTKVRIVDADDAAITEALHMLFADGIIAEPAAATGIAALRKLKLPKDVTVCCTITGSGLKFPQLLQRIAP